MGRCHRVVGCPSDGGGKSWAPGATRNDAMALADVDTRPAGLADEEVGIDQPYHVLLWNDPVTPMPVVVLVLKRIFRYDQEKATTLMLNAHRRGKAVVWTGAREKAVDYSVQLGTAGLQSTVGRDA